ncbi:MAG: two-component regulator propeller domain-containing protein [Crocinitomicaceae bacterium]|nr:two-component regulator propeller domain-containing protein [Crocinitomicaceae bacterium]
MTKSLLFSIAVLLCAFSYGQKYSFVTYSTEQGLPQSQVTAIAQDNNGYLWVGTLGGLAKFNGNKFVTFSTDDGLLNHRITTLAFFDNTLWVGHDGGISFIKNNEVGTSTFVGTGNDRSRNVSKIIKFNNKILICSRGGLFEQRGDELIKIPVGDERQEFIRSAYGYEGKLYLATKAGIIVSSDLKKFELYEELGEESFSDVTGQGDKIVFSSFSQGVFIKNMTTSFTRYFTPEELKYSIYGCYYDPAGNLWMSSLEGVVKIGVDEKLEFYNDSNGLPVNMIGCVFHDDAQNVWIGSLGKGIFRFPSAEFRYFDQTTGLPSDLYITGLQDKFGDYYLGTFDKGIVKKSRTGEITTLNINESTIWASVEDVDGKHWFGTGRSLVSLDPITGSLTEQTSEENDQIPGFKITALFKVSKNAMYVGGNGGAAFYENGEITLLGGEDVEIGTIRDFELLGETLFCVSNLGMFKYENGNFELIPGSEMVAYSIEKDENGILWLGSEEGLYKYVDGTIKRVELFDDPGSNFVAFMNLKDGQLFIGTNNGLFVVSNLYKSKPDIERFGIGDGIIDLETNLNSGFFDQKGDFWFGTASGLVCYHLQRNFTRAPKPRPKVNMTSILLNYEAFDYSKYSDELSETGMPNSLDLPYSKNNLIFEFDGVSLVHQKRLSYQFMLEGLREEWSLPTENNTIAFTSLPAGEYVLHVRAVDIDGRVSEEEVFPFVINQAYYNTWWFITLCILVIVAIFILIFRFRIKRLGEINEREKLEYKSRLLSLEQKSMNASMNRHFIFNSLNSIQYFINTQDRFSANKYLTNFAQLIRKNLDSATSEGNMVSLGEELERLELYLSLESMRFKDKFDYTIETNGIDIELVPIPPMMMQPFIENSIIHGILPNEEKKGLITIDIRKGKEHLEICIEDNGIGINHSLSKKTQSTGDHRSQGMEITSKRIELIQIISDSEISLEGPEEIVDENRLINGTRVLIKIPLKDLEI